MRPNASFRLGTPVASTSGTAIDFTGIPAGVKMIVVSFVGVSTDGTSVPLIQLGDADGIEATEYLGTGSNISTVATSTNYTTGFGLASTLAATNVLHGHAVLVLENSTNNTWTSNSIFSTSEGASNRVGGGSKSLSATLTQVRITTVNGTDTFDAGAINLAWLV